MDKYLLALVVDCMAYLLVIYTQLAPSGGKKKILSKSYSRHFSRYKVIEKLHHYMICEINHRNEPEELVFIRIDPAKRKIYAFQEEC